MSRPAIASWILTVGLAVIFAFFGFGKFLEPVLWLGWIPLWMDGLFTLEADMWLQIIGAFEILCALLIIIPIRSIRQTGAILMALQLLAILPIAGFNDVGLRDFGLMMSAVALWLLI